MHWGKDLTLRHKLGQRRSALPVLFQERALELFYSVSVCVRETERQKEDRLGINRILSNWESIVCSSPLKHTQTQTHLPHRCCEGETGVKHDREIDSTLLLKTHHEPSPPLLCPSSLIFKPPPSSRSPSSPFLHPPDSPLQTFLLIFLPFSGVTALKGHSLLHLRLQNVCLPQYLTTNINECQTPLCCCRLVAFTGLSGRCIMWTLLCCFSHPHRFIVFLLLFFLCEQKKNKKQKRPFYGW